MLPYLNNEDGKVLKKWVISNFHSKESKVQLGEQW